MSSPPILTPKQSSSDGSQNSVVQEPLPDHTQLPESDGTFVKNFQEHPQSLILTSAIEPILDQLHPDGQYCIGQDSGIYWQFTQPPLKGCEAPDWFYVADVPPLLNGEYRRSYVMWKERVIPTIAIEFVSGTGEEERDRTPAPSRTATPDPDQKAGKFWVYEQAIQIPFYAIYEVSRAAVEVYHLVGGQYQPLAVNARGHYEIPPMGVELGILWGQEEPPIPWLRWWDTQGNLLLTGAERATQERQAREQADAIATQERQAREQADAIAAQERQAREQADAIAAQERQAREQADAIATQERQAREQADAIATQERQAREQERQARLEADAIAQHEQQEKTKLAAYLRSLGIDPDEII